MSKQRSEEDTTDLESANTWDFDRAETHPPTKGNRVIVSVAFPRTTFADVSTCAGHLGMRASEFIREAAVEKATRHSETAILSSVSGPFAGVTSSQGRASPALANRTRGTRVKPLAICLTGHSIIFVNEPATA